MICQNRFFRLAGMGLTLLVFALSSDAKIAIWANKNLSVNCKNSIRAYAQAMISFQGKTVALDYTSYDQNTSVTTIKNALNALYTTPNDPIEGAIFVGGMPYALYEHEDPKDPAWPFRFVCDRFFMDLDGVYSDNLKDGSAWGKTGVYDGYTGNLTAEIWITRIDFRSCPDAGSEESLMVKYFSRARNRLAGWQTAARNGLTVEDEQLRNACGISNPAIGCSYTNYTRLLSSEGTVYTENIYAKLQSGTYEYCFIIGHGTSSSSGEIYNTSYNALGASGNPSRCHFFYDLSCSGGAFNQRLTESWHGDCIGELLGLTQSGLISINYTSVPNVLNGLVYSSYATYISQGLSSGEALRRATNERLQTEVAGNLLKFIQFGAGNLGFKPYPEKNLAGARIWTLTSQTAMPRPMSANNTFYYPQNPATMRVGAVTSPADGNIQVIRTKYYDAPSQLVHYYYDPATGKFVQGGAFGSNCWGTPSICANPYNNNNLEVVALNNATKKFDVYFRDQASLRWYGPTASFASNVSTSPALLCNTYRCCIANLEVFYRDGSKLRHFFRLNSDGIWRDGGDDGITATDINGDPAFVQDANGRFHIVVRVSNKTLRHYIRTADYPFTWTFSTISIAGTDSRTEAPGLLYSNYGNALELITNRQVSSSNSLFRHFRFANNAWTEITTPSTDPLLPAAVSNYRHEYVCPVPVMGNNYSPTTTTINLIGVEMLTPNSGQTVTAYCPLWKYAY